MDKHQVIARLREHEDELRAAGVEHIALFGSVARDENTSSSDLDLLVHFSESTLKSGFSFFSLLLDLEERLKTITGAPGIDILPAPIEKERLRKSVEKDQVDAF